MNDTSKEYMGIEEIAPDWAPFDCSGGDCGTPAMSGQALYPPDPGTKPGARRRHIHEKTAEKAGMPILFPASGNTEPMAL